MSGKRKYQERKTNPEAFELQLNEEQQSLLRRWCVSLGYTKARKEARTKWQLEISHGAIVRWFHKDDSKKLLQTLGVSSQIASDIMEATANEKNDPLLACEKAISALALKALDGEVSREEMELALQLFQAALESRSARTKGRQKEEELKLAREKFLKEMKSDLEKALDALSEEVKGNARAEAAMKEIFAALEKK